jgi:hypothetical protein
MTSLEFAVGLFVAVLFAPQLASVLAPSWLRSASFRFAVAAAQALSAVALYAYVLDRGKVWIGCFIVLLVAFYNFWAGLKLRRS